MRTGLSGVLALVLTVSALGCGDAGPTGLTLGGSGSVGIEVTSGITPTITWTGANAQKLSITQSTGGGVFWSIEALDPQAGFTDPLVFGVVPSSAREASPDAQLTSGVNYSVQVTLIDGSSGTKVFKP